VTGEHRMPHETILRPARGLAGGSRGTVAAFSWGLWMAVLAILALPAFAAVPAKDGAAPAKPRLARLLVEIWPEFDRPAALIILKGELTPDTPLPAAVSLRIPAAVGRPSAVAFASSAESELFNLPHEASSAGNDTTVRFSAPQRFFHVEYYDALAKDASMRTYTYVWRSDLAVDRLSVRLQEPAAASGLSVLPDLGPGATGPEGLTYRTAELGAHEAGKQQLVVIRYTKSDSRTSAEILGLNTPPAKAPEAAGSTKSQPAWAPLVAAAVGLTVGLGLLALWSLWRRRKAAPVAPPSASSFCSKCGKALALGDRFCASCGAPVGKRKKR